MVTAAADGSSGSARGRPETGADYREDDVEIANTPRSSRPASGASSIPVSPIALHGGVRCGSAVFGACPPRAGLRGVVGGQPGQPFTPRLKRSNSSGDVLMGTPRMMTSTSASRLVTPRDEQRLREVGQKELHLRAARDQREHQREAQKLQEEKHRHERRVQERTLQEQKEKLQEEERVRRFLEVERRRELAEERRREREQQARTLPSPCGGQQAKTLSSPRGGQQAKTLSSPRGGPSPRGQSPHSKDHPPLSARGSRPNLFMDEKQMISKHERERHFQEVKEAKQRERAECLRQQREVSAGYQAQVERAREEMEQKKVHEQLKQARAREKRQAAAERRAQERKLQAQQEQSRELQKQKEQERVAMFKQQELDDAARQKLRERADREIKIRERREQAAETGGLRRKLEAQARATAEMEKQLKKEVQERRRQEEKLKRVVEIQERKEMNQEEKDKLRKKREDERLTFFFQPPSPRARMASPDGQPKEQDYGGSWLNTPRVRSALGG